MTLFDSPSFANHEGVHAFADEKTGLKAIVAVHSTARGPAVGGTRMWNYGSAAEALEDVLRLSKGMSYKNAVADLEMGGGKSVIIGDSKTRKTPELFRAFGRAIDKLGGNYYAAEDVGVSVEDIAEARKETEYVVGLSGGKEGSGDPSPVTAEGVYRSTLLAARRLWNQDDLTGLTVAVQGIGHVGGYLADKLHAAGAKLIVTDVNVPLLEEVAGRTGAEIVAPDVIYGVKADIYAPCALGATLNPQTLDRLTVKAVVGAANNQLATPEIGRILFERGVLYAPDYVVNGGGIINVASELKARQTGGAYDPAWVEGKLSRLMETLEEVLDRSASEQRPTHEIADAIAEARIRKASELKLAA
ncbi:MAG: amino acid dehydrogenase [Alphaproteobacteria bacterium]|nr:amino acid dehydrogenase [Alphaproteobacteria bacterium]MBU1526128.1 amino acid dehydrogenase [Alphaproteobacteria bacterium]MBU2350235.1 amino acid dehydrogenase [Alphaproteobacteria bacterium]MBU2381395.1 amino acid dehydrogenase [Alphaproteobacteria bacterium]